MKFSIIFRHWAEVFGPCLFFWRVCWNCIPRVHRNTLGKKMSSETNTFPLFLDKNWFFFKTLSRKNSTGLSKMKFAGSKKNFATIFLKVYSSNLFRTLTENLSGFSKENLGVFVKTGFSLPKETFGKKIFFSAKITICFFFGKSSGKLSSDCREIFRRFWSCFLPLQGNLSKKKVLKKFCIFCRHFFRSFPVIAQEMFGGPVKTVFYVSIERIWKEKLFRRTIKIFHRF